MVVENVRPRHLRVDSFRDVHTEIHGEAGGRATDRRAEDAPQQRLRRGGRGSAPNPPLAVLNVPWMNRSERPAASRCQLSSVSRGADGFWYLAGVNVRQP